MEQIQRTHCIHIKPLDGFDLVPEEIEAGAKADEVSIALKIAGKIDVDDAAANRKIARHFHLIQPVVPMLGKPDDQLLRLHLRAALQVQHQMLELRREGIDCINACTGATSIASAATPSA